MERTKTPGDFCLQVWTLQVLCELVTDERMSEEKAERERGRGGVRKEVEAVQG